MPATPMAPLPVGRTFTSSNRIARPLFTAIRISELPSVSRASSSWSPSTIVMALTPVCRGRLNSSSEVFLIIPCVVHNTIEWVSDKLLVLQILDIQYRTDFIVGRDIDQVLDSPALAALFAIGDLIYVQPVATPLFRKEQHCMVCRSYKQMLDIILLPRPAAHRPAATATLLAVFRGRSPFDIPVVGDRDHDVFFADEVLDADLIVQVGDFRFAGVTKLVLYFLEFVTNDIKSFAFIRQQFVQTR